MQTIGKSASSIFKLFAAGAVLALLVLLFPAHSRAQLVTGDVLGTVTDSTGAVVPGAKVTLTNTGTGIASSMISNDQGEFVFSNVQIGTFKVTVESSGFKSFNVANIALAAGQRLRVNAQLQVGSQVETVQVEASVAVQLESDSSDIKSEIATSSMTEMPTNGRNYYSLVALQPGASAGGGSGDPTDNRPSMNFQANGQSSYFNNNMIDGMDNNMVSLGTVAVEPSLDALEQVQVETSNYSAEYSRTGGGIANLITKSGTNQFHGTAFEFMRNDDFDAYGWNSTTKNKLRQNQFGGSFGGPILKNKAFFFGDYQGWRQIQGSTSQAMVMTADENAAVHAYASGSATSMTLSDPFDAWGGTAGTGVTITSGGFTNPVIGAGNTMTGSVNPYGLAELMSQPLPVASCTSQPDGLCGGRYNWTGSVNQIQNANTYDGRIDYHLNDRNTLFGRFSHNLTNTNSPGSLPEAVIQDTTYGQAHPWAGHESVNPVGDNNVALDYVHIFNPTTLFEAKASYGRVNQSSYTKGATAWSLTQLGITSPAGYDTSTLPGLPGMGLDSTSSASPYSNASPTGTGYAFPMDGGSDYFIQNTFQYNASLTMNRKSHSIKTGISLIRRQINSRNADNGGPTFSANYTGNTLTDILEGLAVEGSESVQMVPFHGRFWEPSVYFQDDWRATKSLTLNLGVRYDLYTPETAREGNISNFDLNTDKVVSPSLLGPNKSGPTAGVMTDYKDISPRIGFAYTLPGNNKLTSNMVLRGGFGVSYFPGASGTLPGSHEYQLVNAPYDWSMACGNTTANSFYATNGCGAANNYISSAEYGLYPYGIAAGTYMNNGVDYGAGGFNMQYGWPAAQFVTTYATDPTTYKGGFTSDLFMMPNFKPSYLYQFNLQAQKQIGNNIVTAGFVGNMGRRMPSFQNLNTPATAADLAANNYPLATSVSLESDGVTNWMTGTVVGESISEGNSAWEAGEATYERRLAKGFSVSANYTWARTEAQGTSASECVINGCQMDSGDGTPVTINGWQQYNYSGSTSHRAAGMITYQLPFGQNLHGPLAAAAKGWELNGTGNWNTGAWMTVTSSENQSGFKNFFGANMQQGTEYPNRVSGKSVKPTKQTFSNWINADAFAYQASGLLGNAKYPTVQGPRSRDFDLGMDKTFSLLEGFKLQFRAEAFNLLNMPSYTLTGGGGPPGSGNGPTTLGNASFGQISNVSSDPRIFQFALKLLY